MDTIQCEAPALVDVNTGVNLMLLSGNILQLPTPPPPAVIQDFIQGGNVIDVNNAWSSNRTLPADDALMAWADPYFFEPLPFDDKAPPYYPMVPYPFPPNVVDPDPTAQTHAGNPILAIDIVNLPPVSIQIPGPSNLLFPSHPTKPLPLPPLHTVNQQLADSELLPEPVAPAKRRQDKWADLPPRDACTRPKRAKVHHNKLEF